jgi:4-amino-4-deoxy-L-arabinose transferase-like glycosyltransferase
MSPTSDPGAGALGALGGTLAPPPSPATRARAGLRARLASLSRPRPELMLLLVLSAGLNLWGLSRNGWANEYYSAAVRSMTQSWHAFLYGSFDAAGVMTVDKPPLALWVQAGFAEVFGFHPLSLLVPQALMGVAAVALVYDLTRRRFGRVAGFVAGLALATTPIAVAISRHNNPDALLILCCVAALWLVVRGLEDGRTRWLVAAGVCVGLGFETKMAAALLIVPALAAAWLWVAPLGRLRALRQLLAGGAAMVVVGSAWPALLALTPAADRPWVSGTSDNSILSLILGYNGLGRLAGQSGGPQAFGAGGPGGGGGGGPFGGPAGVLRLLDASLGGQAGWLLGFALVAGIGLVVASRLRRTDARTGWLIAVGGSFLACAVAFSSAQGIFHPYYVAQLAPFTAALVGAGVAQILAGGRAARILGPAAVVAGVLCELLVLRESPGTLGWLVPLLLVGGMGAAVALAGLGAGRVRAAVVASALVLLFAAPVTWSAQTLGHATSGTFPAGGPATSAFAGGPGGIGPAPPRAAGGGMGAAPPTTGPRSPGAGAAPPGMAGAAPGGGMPGRGGFAGPGPGRDSGALTAAVAYAKRHGGGTVAVSSQSAAAPQIVGSGADVVALGGFSGRESEVDAAWLAQAVRDGKVRWVLADGGGQAGPGHDGRVGASALMAAVADTCMPVSVSARGTTVMLYDCQGNADALEAAS